MPDYNFLKKILSNFSEFADRNAFYIQGRYYTYMDLAGRVAGIQSEILNRNVNHRYAGVVLNDDLDTYAAILAIWFSGFAFIPVNPMFPDGRNLNIIRQTGIKLVIQSSPGRIKSPILEGMELINTTDLAAPKKPFPELPEEEPDRDLYVLFTSGSTGVPKGVRLSFRNLNAFVRDFIRYPSYDFTPEDRFLQIYDLSFDASIHCYTVPIAVGACVYTVPQDEIKYLAAYKLMLNQRLTFVKMPPSTLSYLKPYFSSISLPDLRYCLLGGEAFPLSLAEEWKSCVPGALIQNVYGPTEATINCLIYDWNGPDNSRKSFSGIVSIGRPFGSNKALVAGENGELITGPGEGELLVGGDQVSPGYWHNDSLNQSAYLIKEVNGRKVRLYRTGDMVAVDRDGDFMFIRRKDEQVQVQGYRVELGEIEEVARQILDGINVVALGRETEPGQMVIWLLVEAVEVNNENLKKLLAGHLPAYMVPSKIVTLNEFPRLVSGKLDRRALINTIPDE